MLVNDENRWPGGKLLQAARKRAGMSGRELAEASGYSRSVIANLENGRSADLTVGRVVVLADALGVPPYAIDDRLRARQVVPHATDDMIEAGLRALRNAGDDTTMRELVRAIIEASQS